MSGDHPLFKIADLHPAELEKDLDQAALTSGMMSVGTISRSDVFVSTRSRRSFSFSMVSQNLNWPFISSESPTCQRAVPYGTPMQQRHGCRSDVMYLRKDKLNRVWCPSRRSVGVIPFLRSAS